MFVGNEHILNRIDADNYEREIIENNKINNNE